MGRRQRQKRIIALLVLLLLVGLILLARLCWLQLIRGPDLAQAAVFQRSLRHIYTTGRGQILDRHGRSLTDTRFEPVLVAFMPVLGEEVRQTLAPAGLTAAEPVRVFRGLTLAAIRRWLASGTDGLAALSQEVRYGPQALAPHVTGYVQRRDTTHTRPRYREVTYLPFGGLEQTFHEELAGERPLALAVTIDGRGRLIRGPGFRHTRENDPRRPYNIVTTIDSRIQAVVERLGARHLSSGAIIVLEPQSGDLLALASFPSFDPADLHHGISRQEFAGMQANPGRPFVNKALAAYPPGSVFKVVLAAAALERNLPYELLYCTGTTLVGEREVSCYQGRSHGQLGMTRALALSCNAYFIRLGQRLGRETVLDFAVRFGFARRTGIPLPGEDAGRLPTLEELPYLGDLANTSLGQGLVEATPLQLARLLAVAANNGLDVPPRLVQAVTDRQGRTVRRYTVPRRTRAVSPATARQLRSMLGEVVQSGTARDADSPHLATAGKSGTAQSGRRDPHVYSWFAGLAESGNERLVIVIFAEQRRELSASAIFRLLAEDVLPR
jgi:cell division protein FtsI/penicillin-binding protein 2